MASEARLVSYLAVMTQQVPLRHWFRLGRPLVKTSGGVSLLSWSGTLFEYWMPHILLPLIPGTLLHGICKNAARAQARHPLGGAWGISESGYYAFDPQLNYQYKAFGLSELALNSGSQDKVIAPYASALAASLMPRRTAENLIRMMNRGWACPTGLYEAADFNPSRIPKGEGHRLIRSQMAHHQGMVLCALTNALTNGFLTRCLMALPAAQAYRFLLEENMADRAPNRRIPQIKKRETLAQEEWQDAYQAEPFALPLAGQILSGGASTLFADALGNGFMCHEGLMLNRFSGEAGRKEGIQFYLREGSANRVFQPTDPLLPGSVTFSAGRAIYHRLVDELSVTLTCWVNPIDGAFLHLMEIENQQKTDRILEAASFFALTLLDKQADLAHPAFRELFVETAQLSPRTLIARRRPRQPSEPSPTLTHTLSCDGQVLHYAWQTDRCAFVGRNGSLFHPADMQRPIQAVSSMAGAPIHPCMSLRCQLMLPAKGRVQLLFATVLAEESLLTPAGVQERYDHPRKALTILKLAQTQSLSALRHAGLTPQEQGDAARLGACLLLRGMGVEHTSPASKEVLWRFGISGDLPLWFLHVAQARPSTLLNLCLSIHRLLRLQGVATHLMLLCSESHEDCFQMLEDLIPLPERQWIKWTSPEQADEDTVAALCAFSRLILWDNGGSLASQ
ncbi:MAG: hypothetical protein IJ461_03775, partial [Clostridia bacterium]|nr:hypothetical protein [Clostridia bacterium]